MDNLNNAVKHIANNELLKAKEIIHAALYSKMGKLLEDKLIEFAPSVFAEAKEKDEDDSEDEDTEDTDTEDSEDSEDEDEQLKEDFEAFSEYLSHVIDEVEKETGKILTEEEISEVAHTLLNEKLDDVGEEDDDIDNDGDSDESDSYLKNRRSVRSKAIDGDEDK